MECIYCGTTLSPLRSITQGEFCSDDHRSQYALENASADYLFIDPPEPANPVPLPAPDLRAPSCYSPRCNVQLPLLLPVQFENNLITAGLVPCLLRPSPAAPSEVVSNPRPRVPRLTPQLPKFSPRPRPIQESRFSWIPTLLARRAWRIPSSYKTGLLCLIPILIAAFLSSHFIAGLRPKSFPSVATTLKQLKDEIHSRAAIDLIDDFRTGLDQWQARGELASAWRYDPEGFARPGSLAVYRPSMHLTDYRLEFLAEVEQHAIGVAFRVKDWKNYYAFKVLSTSGAHPTINIVHYRFVDGHETDRVARSIPTPLRNISMYRVLLNVRGNEFTLMTQGQFADYWSDGKYSEGGVGFFCGSGERARLRWVQVTHQADAFGKLCALIAPYDTNSRRLDRN